MTTRGNAAGTTETRALFWGAILNHSVTNPTTFLFGSGFKEGFLEVTMPYFEFTDKELIEPHNAFMGIYFKTGIIGLLLLYLYLADLQIVIQQAFFRKHSTFLDRWNTLCINGSFTRKPTWRHNFLVYHFC